jgi:hypothetical protein
MNSFKRRIAIAMLAAGAALLTSLGASAQAATTVGQTFEPTLDFGGEGDSLQQTSIGISYATPTPGVITAWSYQSTGPLAPPVPPLKLKVFRQVGAADYLVVGASALRTPILDSVNTFATRIPVRGGDRLGLHFTDTTYYARQVDGWALAERGPGDPAPGTTGSYEPQLKSQLDVSAQLEPDADADGYGDETQDACATDSTTQGPCDTEPPETTIVSGPNARVSKPKAMFSFASSEANSSFQCRLQGKRLDEATRRFTPCAATRRYRHLRHGTYVFSVVATDGQGNADPTPAQQRFNVIDKA